MAGRRGTRGTPTWLIAACLAFGSASAEDRVPAPMPERATPSPVDYRDPAHWLCRPGLEGSACGEPLAAKPVGGGSSAPETGATARPIDCFYVYPTASMDATWYSGLAPDAAVVAVVRTQASWLAAHCRVFAPAYHQVTIAALKWQLTRDPASVMTPIDIPYRDVLAAWRDYLARDNAGRGVVLIGHSQGARILQRLIAEEVDDQPAQRLLVAAYLAGNTGLHTKSFRTVAPCRTIRQTGCVVAWSSYRDDYAGRRLFGTAPRGTEPVCVNPAAFGGGRGRLKAAIARPIGDPPIIAVEEGLSAECVSDVDGAVLRVRIDPGPDAASLDTALTASRAGPAWGLHPHDMGLVRGNLRDAISVQTEAWLGR